jgi:hypothetical protein
VKKFLAILFLAIFSCQVLPMKVFGKLIAGGQNMEEVQNDADDPDVKVTKIGEEQIMDNYSFDEFSNRIGFNQKICAFIHKAESLPSVHVAKKPAPPPER